MMVIITLVTIQSIRTEHLMVELTDTTLRDAIVVNVIKNHVR